MLPRLDCYQNQDSKSLTLFSRPLNESNTRYLTELNNFIQQAMYDLTLLIVAYENQRNYSIQAFKQDFQPLSTKILYSKWNKHIVMTVLTS